MKNNSKSMSTDTVNRLREWKIRKWKRSDMGSSTQNANLDFKK